jgi:hypothetical protein
MLLIDTRARTARRAQQAREFAGAQVEVDAGDGERSVRVSLGDTAQLDDCAGIGSVDRRFAG